MLCTYNPLPSFPPQPLIFPLYCKNKTPTKLSIGPSEKSNIAAPLPLIDGSSTRDIKG